MNHQQINNYQYFETMNTEFITLTENNIADEHIWCAFSDKKCKEGYEQKKDWLTKEFQNGFVFRRLNERAKVFIEYVPAEKGWAPIDAPNYLLINCFWVAGQYKGKGYGKALLQSAIDDAIQSGKDGLVTIAGSKKLHYMSDTKWLLRQGFEECQKLPYGISLFIKKIKQDANNPTFRESVLMGECDENNGLTVYYSIRCPFTEFYINTILPKTVAKRNIPLNIIKLKTMEQAQSAPTPATIFSIFYNGKFVSNDISLCLDNRFDKIVKIG